MKLTVFARAGMPIEQVTGLLNRKTDIRWQVARTGIRVATTYWYSPEYEGRTFLRSVGSIYRPHTEAIISEIRAEVRTLRAHFVSLMHSVRKELHSGVSAWCSRWHAPFLVAVTGNKGASLFSQSVGKTSWCTGPPILPPSTPRILDTKKEMACSTMWHILVSGNSPPLVPYGLVCRRILIENARYMYVAGGKEAMKKTSILRTTW
jgi:hypothetical protein